MKQSIETVNPINNAVLNSYPIDDEAAVERALTKAAEFFSVWRKTSFADRALLMKEVARCLRIDKEHLATLATFEMGKPIHQSREEVEKCARTLDFYADNAVDFLSREWVQTDAVRSYVSYQPLGPVLAIMPWNFPYWQVFRAAAPALMAGNTMVLKHASNVSGCALAIAEVFRKADATKGLFQTLVIPASRVGDIIDDKRVAAVTFTGSTEAGQKVAEAAGRNLKKVVLELGGSDAYVVLEDADMEVALEIALRGRLVNSGQSCVSAKRFIVVKHRLAEFEDRFTALMQSATFGDPMDEMNRIGPLARLDLRQQLHEQVLKSLEAGATLRCGGYIPDRVGAFYPPTVLTGVMPGMPAYEEELFGPVAAIIAAENEQDAIRIANDTVYGLGGGIISTNRDRAEWLAENELQAGNCYVNDFVHSDPMLPFGGVKHSGYGRELGVYGIREFVNIKSVYVK